MVEQRSSFLQLLVVVLIILMAEVIGGRFSIQLFKEIMKETRITFQSRANIRTIEYAQAMVRAGVEAAILPDWEEIRETDEIVSRKIKNISLNQTIGLAYNRGRATDPLLRTTIDICRNYRRTFSSLSNI